MKLTGVLLMAVCCVLWGLLAAGRLAERVHLLEEVLAFLRALVLELEFTQAPPEALLQCLLSRKSLSLPAFPAETCRLCREGMAFPEAMGQAVREDPAPYTREERALLLQLAEILGATELEGQLCSLRQITGEMEERYRAAREEREQKSRLYRTFGTAAGAAVLLLML